MPMTEPDCREEAIRCIYLSIVSVEIERPIGLPHYVFMVVFHWPPMTNDGKTRCVRYLKTDGGIGVGISTIDSGFGLRGEEIEELFFWPPNFEALLLAP